MSIIKFINVISIFLFLSVVAVGQTTERKHGGTVIKKETTNFSAFVFSIRGIVTEVLDGCSVVVEIKEGRKGEIQGQKIEIRSGNPKFEGSLTIRLMNTKCVSKNERIVGAEDHLKRMANNRAVEILFKSYADLKDSKITAQLVLSVDGRDLGLEQLKTGWAAYRKDKMSTLSNSDKSKYKEASKKAKREKIGMYERIGIRPSILQFSGTRYNPTTMSRKPRVGFEVGRIV